MSGKGAKVPDHLKIIVFALKFQDLVNFRLGLLRGMKAKGHDPIAVAALDQGLARLRLEGIECRPVEFDRAGANVFKELLFIRRIFRLYRSERPDIAIHYSIKPNIYGALAAKLAGVPSINVVAGLGYVFLRDTYLARIAKALWRIAFRFPERVLTLNEDDARLLVEGGYAVRGRIERIKGEGIDCEHFSPSYCDGVARESRAFTFLLLARMLMDKGVGEFVEAASIVRVRHPDSQFILLGPIDTQNPSGIPEEQLQEWNRQGVVRYLGVTDEVRTFICRSDCVVLPSYREGLPHSLLEGAAMEKPVITTDSVGCREVVEEGVNGFLVKPRDVGSLADAMLKMIDLPEVKRIEMGKRGREKAVGEFSDQLIVDRIFGIIDEVLKENAPGQKRQ